MIDLNKRPSLCTSNKLVSRYSGRSLIHFRGLGAGIASTAFVQHNLSTTVVEIDPAVYEAAHRYFGLATPDPGHLFLEDARLWVRRRRMQTDHAAIESTASGPPPLFDIVVHDCFSGGGVPGHIFTVEFWQDLKVTMRNDGVVAVVIIILVSLQG